MTRDQYVRLGFLTRQSQLTVSRHMSRQKGQTWITWGGGGGQPSICCCFSGTASSDSKVGWVLQALNGLGIIPESLAVKG